MRVETFANVYNLNGITSADIRYTLQLSLSLYFFFSRPLCCTRQTRVLKSLDLAWLSIQWRLAGLIPTHSRKFYLLASNISIQIGSLRPASKTLKKIIRDSMCMFCVCVTLHKLSMESNVEAFVICVCVCVCMCVLSIPHTRSSTPSDRYWAKKRASISRFTNEQTHLPNQFKSIGRN